GPAPHARQLGEHADGHAARGLGEYPFSSGEQADGGHYLRFRNSLYDATCLARDPDDIGAVRGVANRDRLRDGVRPYRHDALGAFHPGVVNRRAAESLGASQSGQPVTFDEAQVEQFLSGAAVAHELAAGGDRDDYLVWQPPV